MLEENKLTKLLGISIIVLVVILFGGYLLYYNSFGELNKESNNASSDSNFSPIEPFIAYSSLKPNIIELFGEGTQGEGVSDDTKYIDYKQKWFSLNADARYYYGKYKRVYRNVLTFSIEDKDKLYKEMIKNLGNPLEDNFGDLENKNPKAFWIKDSVSYELNQMKNKLVVESRLSYYDNPNNYDMGDRPTVIQRINSDITGDGEKDAILLIGSKSNYTDKIYNKLFILVGNSSAAYFTSFPQNLDGGSNPKLKISDIDYNGMEDILVESDLFYIKSFNGFAYKDNKIVNIYSSENEPGKNN